MKQIEMPGFLKYPRFRRDTYQTAPAGPASRPESAFPGPPFSPVLNGGNEAIDHPRLMQLYEYWNDKRGNRSMPSRADLDPLDLRALLPNIALVDIEEGPRRYRYRLVGTALIAVLGQDLTGKYLDQMPMLFRRFAGNAYDELMARKAPTYAVFDTNLPLLRTVRYKRLMLPLSADGQRVNMVIAGFFPY